MGDDRPSWGSGARGSAEGPALTGATAGRGRAWAEGEIAGVMRSASHHGGRALSARGDRALGKGTHVYFSEVRGHWLRTNSWFTRQNRGCRRLKERRTVSMSCSSGRCCPQGGGRPSLHPGFWPEDWGLLEGGASQTCVPGPTALPLAGQRGSGGARLLLPEDAEATPPLPRGVAGRAALACDHYCDAPPPASAITGHLAAPASGLP